MSKLTSRGAVGIRRSKKIKIKDKLDYNHRLYTGIKNITTFRHLRKLVNGFSIIFKLSVNLL